MDKKCTGQNLPGTKWMCLLAGIGMFASTAPAQTLAVLHAFTSPVVLTNQDGANPIAGLSSMGDILCGTTVNGGRYGMGTIFYVNTNGSVFNAFRVFTNSPDAGNPQSDLVVLANRFYGTSFGGGANGTGAVFTGQTNGSVSLVCSFTTFNSDNATNTTGASPGASAVLSGGTLYGTANAGGTSANGTVFSVNTNGSSLTVLHHFTALDPVTGTNTDGAYPQATLILSGNTLYGTAPAGGTGADGTVFSLNTNGTQFKTLYNFTATNPGNGTNTDGAFPIADLLLLGNSLYGTAFSGGPEAAGTVFSLTLPVILPATITNIVRNLDGSVTLSFLGNPDSTNVVRATTNLLSANWQDLSTNVADGGAWQFTDTNAVQFPAWFYRSYSL